jgi:hypothetical protein
MMLLLPSRSTCSYLDSHDDDNDDDDDDDDDAKKCNNRDVAFSTALLCR